MVLQIFNNFVKIKSNGVICYTNRGVYDTKIKFYTYSLYRYYKDSNYNSLRSNFVREVNY